MVIYVACENTLEDVWILVSEYICVKASGRSHDDIIYNMTLLHQSCAKAHTFCTGGPRLNKVVTGLPGGGEYLVKYRFTAFT